MKKLKSESRNTVTYFVSLVPHPSLDSIMIGQIKGIGYYCCNKGNFQWRCISQKKNKEQVDIQCRNMWKFVESDDICSYGYWDIQFVD